VADKRLLVLETELARMLKVAGRDGSILSPLLRRAWDGHRLEVRSRSKLSVASAHHVGVNGHVTAEELRGRLDDREVYGGLANRMLWVCVERKDLLPRGGNVPDQLAAEHASVFRHAVERVRSWGLMTRTPEAEDRWEIMYKELAEDDPDGLLGAAIARAAPQCLRLSLLYALLDESPAIKVCHVEAAYALWSYCRASAEWIWGDAIGDQQADKLLRAIRAARHDGLDGTEQSDLFGRNVSAGKLEQLRQRLGFRINTITEPSGGKGGRPRIVSYAAGVAPYEKTPPCNEKTS
jgi:hypothetical protein